MHSGITVTNTILVTAFRAALMRQGLTALLALVTLAIIWASLREWRPSLRGGARQTGDEPAARRLIRIGFGLLWVFDGILQAQPAMAAGLPSQVVAPAAASSPGWVRDLVNWAGTSWTFHPIQASTATVWVQVGIGVWMLAAARGPWSRLAGLAGAGWGLVVWVFGEAFGGIMAPGLTLLFGAPGAVIFYCAGGALVALPGRHWRRPALGRWLLAGLGLFFAGMAVLQAWPGRGFWQGRVRGGSGTLTSMIREMSQVPQPVPLAHLVTGFASFTASHGFLVNTVAVTTLALLAAGLLSQRRELLVPVLVLATVFSLADWVLVEDVGFFGGLGTDPNSMLPLLLLVGCGYLAVTRAPAAAAEADLTGEQGVQADPAGEASPSWRERLRPIRLAGGLASASATGILAIWAVGITLAGAAPLAMAQANPNADPIIARALGGSNAVINVPATPFRLADADGRQVSLASLRGKVVLLTFLDPVCTTDCPLIAQELRVTDQMLGARAADVEIVAIAANPLYYTRPYLRAFDRQERLTGLANWRYLTGPLPELRRLWTDYGIDVEVLPSGQMISHSDTLFVIRDGKVLTELDSDPGSGTSSTKSSFAVEFTQAAEQALSHAS
jgi:cytochrome oxidase Cu insertion factor (SCO1/SenC/PrrC family)